jgi:hypothetical protein
MNQPIIYTPSERASYLQQWKASKLGLPAFSKQSGVPLTSLRYWAYGAYNKSKINQVKPAAFLPVHVTEDYCPGLEIILDLPKGMRMTLRGAITPEYLKALIS